MARLSKHEMASIGVRVRDSIYLQLKQSADQEYAFSKDRPMQKEFHETRSAAFRILAAHVYATDFE